MHLAVLMTNTDESDFAQVHPKDGVKFARMIHRVRPDWQVTSFSVKDDVFPDDLSVFDGVMITGSPASVHDTDPWVGRLRQLIRDMFANGMPLFGACYGHQAIALALGGTVERNAHGWVFGLTHSKVAATTPWTKDLPKNFAEYGAHIECVTQLPQGAEVLANSDACTVTGYRIGNTVYTTQNHPEMDAEFVAALIGELAAKLPAEVVQNARSSLAAPADTLAYAETIAQFFEQASTD